MFYHLFVEKVMINNCYVLKVMICIIFVEINCRYFIFVFNKNDCSEWVSILRSPVSESPAQATCLHFTVFFFFLHPKSKIPAAESIFPLESKFALTGKEN